MCYGDEFCSFFQVIKTLDPKQVNTDVQEVLYSSYCVVLRMIRSNQYLK